MVVKADFGTLQFAQAFSLDTNNGALLWASPLIQRSNCNYNYISKE